MLKLLGSQLKRNFLKFFFWVYHWDIGYFRGNFDNDWYIIFFLGFTWYFQNFISALTCDKSFFKSRQT